MHELLEKQIGLTKDNGTDSKDIKLKFENDEGNQVVAEVRYAPNKEKNTVLNKISRKSEDMKPDKVP